MASEVVIAVCLVAVIIGLEVVIGRKRHPDDD